ncbi:MAG: metallophosphatase family protein [Lachnospiraceae bacterium]|nr:metallophosphatase family protein [Lachnospiraceae bacterium]
MHKIGVLSDTHGLLREEVTEILKECDVILHAGDIDRDKVIKQLESMAPCYAVRGNADKEWAEELPVTQEIELYGIRIYMIHNKKMAELNDADLFIYGHSHKYEEKEVDGQVWLNPGSCGKRRFTQPITMAVVEVEEDGSWHIIRKDIVTGENAVSLQGTEQDKAALIKTVMKEVDKGTPVEKIAQKAHISEELASQICRMYVTHRGIGVDGILNRIS